MKPSFPTLDLRYYVEIHYGSSSSDSYVSLVAHLMETDYAEADTGMAEHEIQDLKFSSTVTKEILVSSQFMFHDLYSWDKYSTNIFMSFLNI